ncbi:ER lumen protein-retaining receptor 3 [Serendipita sp. 405]|nr:ER lumen protein-retaining receptor 3 [Serendipita sp. 405]
MLSFIYFSRRNIAASGFFVEFPSVAWNSLANIARAGAIDAGFQGWSLPSPGLVSALPALKSLFSSNMSSYDCLARYAGDMAAILAYPILIRRILKRGNDGLSVTSQMLHVVVFTLRYADMESWFLQALMIMRWAAIVRVLAFSGAIAVPITMAYRARTSGHTTLSRANISKVTFEALKYIIPAFLIAYRFNYTSFSWVPTPTSHQQPPSDSLFATLLSYFSVEDFVNMDEHQAYEVAWSTSIFLAAIADIPQYITYYRHVQKKMDWWLVSSLALVAFGRIFYAIHWVSNYVRFQFFDCVSFAGALVQVLAFWIFFVLTVSKVNDVLSDNDKDLEAQIEEFDARWGQFSEAEIPVFNVEKK